MLAPDTGTGGGEMVGGRSRGLLEGGAASYSPEESDTHYHRYNGRRSLSALPDEEEEEEEEDQSAMREDEEEEEVGGEEEEEEDDEGSVRGEDAVEVPVINLPDSLKERLESDMRAIQGTVQFVSCSGTYCS
jgi:hypothetical protein